MGNAAHGTVHVAFSGVTPAPLAPIRPYVEIIRQDVEQCQVNLEKAEARVLEREEELVMAHREVILRKGELDEATRALAALEAA